MERKIVRLYLNEIKVNYNGDEIVSNDDQARNPDEDNKEALDNAILATLEYPRSGAALVSSMKTMDLPSRYVYDLRDRDIWTRSVFKEEVQGETKLSISVTDKDKRSTFSRWFSKFFGLALNAYLGGAVKGISSIYSGAVAGDIQSNIIKGVKSGEEESVTSAIATTGDIYIVLDGNGIKISKKAHGEWEHIQQGDDFVLKLEAPVAMRKRGPLLPGESPTYETIIDKGESNGYVTLSYELVSI